MYTFQTPCFVWPPWLSVSNTMYCLQWLIPVLLLPKPVRTVRKIKKQFYPQLLGESRPVVQPRDVHHAVPDRLLLGEEALHHLLTGKQTFCPKHENQQITIFQVFIVAMVLICYSGYDSCLFWSSCSQVSVKWNASLARGLLGIFMNGCGRASIFLALLKHLKKYI